MLILYRAQTIVIVINVNDVFEKEL
jgi:hypothetical protein